MLADLGYEVIGLDFSSEARLLAPGGWLLGLPWRDRRPDGPPWVAAARSAGSQRRSQPQSATTSGWGSGIGDQLNQQTLPTNAGGIALKAPINGAHCIGPYTQPWPSFGADRSSSMR